MSRTNGGLKAVVLDLDDTILDEAPGRAAGRAAALNTILEAHPDLSPCDLGPRLDAISIGFWANPRRNRTGRLDMPGSRRRILALLLVSADRPDADLARRAAAAYTDARNWLLRTAEGADDVLARLRKRAPKLALLTNGSGEAQRAKIERFDLARYFDRIQIEGEFGVGKPDRWAFDHLLGALGVEAREAVMVGDSLSADVAGAIGAGMQAVWIDRKGTGLPESFHPRPTWILRSFAEVGDCLCGDP